MIASFIMTTTRVYGLSRGIVRCGRAPIPALCALLVVVAGQMGFVAWASPAAPPVPSTGAPHPSAPVVRALGMTLEIRAGRIVVAEVEKDSPADRAGMLPFDVLLVVNGRNLVDLDPVSPQQVLGLLQQEATLRTSIVLGRGAGTLAVELPGLSGQSTRTSAPRSELRPGLMAPPFTGSDLRGKEVALKDLRGRLVLMDFWASNCPPCLPAVIPLRRIAEQYAKSLEIVGVSLDADRKAFEAFVYNHHLPGIQLFDGAGWLGEIPRAYGVAATGIPHYVLIGPDGRIVGTGDLNEIEKEIARRAPATS